MTIRVTIEVNENPPGTAVEVLHISKMADGEERATTLAVIGAGQSHTAYLWVGQDIRLVEQVADAATFRDERIGPGLSKVERS